MGIGAPFAMGFIASPWFWRKTTTAPITVLALALQVIVDLLERHLTPGELLRVAAAGDSACSSTARRRDRALEDLAVERVLDGLPQRRRDPLPDEHLLAGHPDPQALTGDCLDLEVAGVVERVEMPEHGAGLQRSGEPPRRDLGRGDRPVPTGVNPPLPVGHPGVAGEDQREPVAHRREVLRVREVGRNPDR